MLRNVLASLASLLDRAARRWLDFRYPLLVVHSGATIIDLVQPPRDRSGLVGPDGHIDLESLMAAADSLKSQADSLKDAAVKACGPLPMLPDGPPLEYGKDWVAGPQRGLDEIYLGPFEDERMYRNPYMITPETNVRTADFTHHSYVDKHGVTHTEEVSDNLTPVNPAQEHLAKILNITRQIPMELL